MAVVNGAMIACIRSAYIFVESREYFSGLEGGHIEEATPNFSGGETAGRKARDDAKVVGAAFKGTPEVGMI